MKHWIIFLCVGMVCLFSMACSNQNTESTEDDNTTGISSNNPDNPNSELDFADANLKTIYFAGGCFWGVEAFFEEIPGVYDATSGYANGEGEDPTYREVIKGDKNFAETVEVTYDSKQVELNDLMDYFFRVIDPTSVDQQGNDIGTQYRTGIYYEDDADEPVIEDRIDKEQQAYDKPIATEVEPLHNYYLAEEEHQDYLEKNPNGYCHIDMNELDDIQK